MNDTAERDSLLARAFGATPSTSPLAGADPRGFVDADDTYAEPGLCAGIAGRASWIARDQAQESPAALLARAYRRRGRACLAELRGPFAAVVLDLDAGRALLALDRMGRQTLAYAIERGSLVVGSSVGAVVRGLAAPPSMRPQGLFDFLLLHMVPSPDTVYEGVRKLRPGSFVEFVNGKVESGRHWTPEFRERGAREDAALGERIEATLAAAVAAVAEPACGAFLSGGLDSSTVSGMLARANGRNARTFSIGFGTEGFDELEYARIASRHFHTAAHEYVVTPDDVVDAIPRIAAAYDEPFGNSSAVPTFFCARLARQHGVKHLLAGDGGDEIFGGNERYARQKVFEAYGSLPGAARRLIEAGTRTIDPECRVTPLRKLRSYVDQARIPMPERLESWNLMYRNDLGTLLEPEFRNSVDPRYALRLMSEVYGQTDARSLVNRMLHFDWQYTLSDNDLRKVTTMCALAGVRVSYPMLDDAVVDLSLEVLPEQKVRGSELRDLYKRALARFLPRQIIEKKKHGFGLPFGLWLREHRPLADLVYGLLAAFKSRRLVRPDFLDRIVAEHRTGHPGYYGYAIWDLAMLEAWLAAHMRR